MDSKRSPFILMILIAIGFFGLMLVLAFHSVPTENKDTLVTMLGDLGAAFGMVVGYYFGSSIGKGAANSPTPTSPVSAPTPAPQEGQ